MVARRNIVNSTNIGPCFQMFFRRKLGDICGLFYCSNREKPKPGSYILNFFTGLVCWHASNTGKMLHSFKKVNFFNRSALNLNYTVNVYRHGDICLYKVENLKHQINVPPPKPQRVILVLPRFSFFALLHCVLNPSSHSYVDVNLLCLHWWHPSFVLNGPYFLL